MDYRMDYNKVGWFNHRVDVHTGRLIYRFYGKTKRMAYKKARRYFSD